MKIRKFGIALALLLIPALGLAQTPLCDSTSTSCIVPNDFSVGGDAAVAGSLAVGSPRGAVMSFVQLEGAITGTGATISASNLIPAGTVVMGCVLNVTTAFTGSGLSSFTIGDGTDADRWGATIALAAGTKTTSANFTAAGPVNYTSATSVVLTGTGGSFATGAARVTCYGYRFTAPLS